MSSEEDGEEHGDYAEWNLGENEPDETADGSQHFNDVMFMMFCYVDRPNVLHCAGTTAAFCSQISNVPDVR